MMEQELDAITYIDRHSAMDAALFMGKMINLLTLLLDNKCEPDKLLCILERSAPALINKFKEPTK